MRGASRTAPKYYVTALGFVGMLTAMSSAMIYGLLPVFMVRVLGISIASVGIIEGVAEFAASLIKIVSGAASDRIGRRKPLCHSWVHAVSGHQDDIPGRGECVRCAGSPRR